MAQIESSDSKGRGANTEVNLIPFIDLMSVLITFLLLTAVWTQVSMIQLGSSIYGKRTSDQMLPPPPSADIPVRLDVKEYGFRLVVGAEKFVFNRVGADWVITELQKQLEVVKAKYPEKTDAVITVDNEIAYEKMILGMDALLGSGFNAISISTVEAE